MKRLPTAPAARADRPRAATGGPPSGLRPVRVGDRLDPAIPVWPELAHYAWDPANGPTSPDRLTVFVHHPTAAQQALFAPGAWLELALVLDGPAIVLLWRGDGWPTWSDAPYSWHALPADRQVRPGVDRGDIEAPLDMILVDARDGRIVAMRRAWLPSHFGRGLHQAIRDQAARPWDPPAYDRALQALTRDAPDLLAGAGRGAVHGSAAGMKKYWRPRI